MKKLTVFDGVPIPVDYAPTQTFALLAKRGGGKTYATMLFEEQMCDAGLFFVTLDPVGKHWALRVGANGKKAGGKDVWVLGGAHGDVQLEPNSGELIADTVIEHPGRYVLDLSGFETDADQDRFALAFAKRLFRRKARDAGFPLMLILEEAESFIPEKPPPGQQPMLGAFGRIMRQGRNHGLGMWMVAQRAQALNKGVLSQAEVLVAKQMAHKRDRDAVDDWVKANGTAEERAELMGSLASLHQDEAWVWSPSWLRKFARTRVLPRVTFDSSASVRSHEGQRKVELTPLDVGALGERMEEVAERSKAEDPKELRKQITKLERELAKRPDAPTPEPEKLEVPVLREGEAEQLFTGAQKLIGAAEQIRMAIKAEVDPLVEGIDKVVEALHRIESSKRAGAVPRRRESRASRVAAAPAPASPRPAPAPDSNGWHPTRAHYKILNGLAEMEALGLGPPSDRTQLALFIGVSSTSGGYFNNLSKLRTNGYIDYPADKMLALTEHGRELADPPGAPSTPEDVQQRIMQLVGRSHGDILAELIAVYPDALSRDELAERTDHSPTSGGYFNKLSKLRTLGIVDYPSKGYVVARPVLFLES